MLPHDFRSMPIEDQVRSVLREFFAGEWFVPSQVLERLTAFGVRRVSAAGVTEVLLALRNRGEVELNTHEGFRLAPAVGAVEDSGRRAVAGDGRNGRGES